MVKPLCLWQSLIRTFFRLLYGPFAWAYDGIAWLVSLGKWTAWGRVALPYAGASPILELAHGPGHLLNKMAQQGLRPVGLDLSPQMGHLARRRLLRAGYSARLVRARAQALPFCDRSFPTIVATFPTEFILDPRTVEEIRRVLSDEGKIVVVAGCRLTGWDPLSLFLEWLYRVTGQREPLPRADQAPWTQSGFILHTEWVPVGRSRVLVVVGYRLAGHRSQVGRLQVAEEPEI